MEDIDRDLLYAIAEAEKTGRPVSTWYLASLKAKTSTERNKLDGIYRYHLEQLTEKGLIVKKQYRKGKQQYTEYLLNPSKKVCSNGTLFILANPILAFECPYTRRCPSKCNLKFYERKGKLIVKGCKLLKEAPNHVKQLILEHLSQT